MNVLEHQSVAADRKRSAIVYVRVSTQEQAEGGYSIQAQKRLLRAYAKEQNFSIARVYTDVETAKRAGRSAFGQMLQYLREHPNCRLVLVEKTDRLYRNLKDYIKLDELNLEIHFVKENKILSEQSNSSEKFLHGIKVLMAKNYIDNLSEESSKGMREKARQGLWPSVAPIGYINTTDKNGKKVIVPDPERANIITWLFEQYADGDISVKELAKKAQEAGLTHKGKGTPLVTASLHRILKNRIYYGDFSWGGKIYQGKHTPLVSRHLWQSVQDRLSNRNNRKYRKVKNEFPYARLMQCGHCGCAIVAERKKGKYTYYHCTGHKGSCNEPYVREEVLEEQFMAYLKALSFDQEVCDYVMGKLKKTRKRRGTERRKRLNTLREEYKRIEAKVDSIYEDRLNNLISPEMYSKQSAKWIERLDEVAAYIDKLESETSFDINKSISLLELARNAEKMFRKRSGKEKRKLLKKLFSNCYWMNSELVVEYRQPFGIIADTNKVWNAQKANPSGNLSISEIWYP